MNHVGRWLFAAHTLAFSLSTSVAADAQPRKPKPDKPDPAARAAEAAAEAESGDGEALAARLRALMSRPGGLTADAVGRRVAASNVNVRVRQAEVAAASADVDKALVAFFPRLTLTARYTRLSPIEQESFGPSGANLVATPAGEGPLPPGAPLIGVPSDALKFPTVLDNYLLQATLIVPISDYVLRISQGYSAASHAESAANANLRATRLAAAADARIVYYGWARAKLQQEVAQQNLTQAEAHLKSAREALNAERASKADVLRAESSVANSELFLERAKNLTELSEDRLRTLLKDPADKRYAIGENLLGPGPAGAERTNFSTLYAEAQKKRLEFRAIERSQRAIKQQKKVATAGAFPRLDAFGNAYYANPNPRYVPQVTEFRATWDVGLQLTWTPNEIGTASAAAAALEAQHEKLAAQRSQLSEALRAEVFEAMTAAREAEVAIKTSERALKAAEESYRVRSLQFSLGRATSVELGDAETNLLRARLETINSRIALRVARVKLEHAIGRDVSSKNGE